MNLDKELRIALEAVKNGCLLSRAVQKGIRSVAKEDRSPVTIADLGTQCVISMHHFGENIFYAVKGRGSFARPLNGGAEKQINVDDVSDPAQAVFCESVESAHAAHGDHAKISERLGMTRPPFRMDSQCKYAAVARGDASIYLRLPSRKDYQECIWDHAAGSIIVEEAGGKVTDCDGKRLDFTAGRHLINNRGIVATNGRIHNEVLKAVSSL